MSTDTRLRFNKKSLENVPLPQPGSRLTFHDLEVPGLMGRYLWDLMRRRRRASDSDWVFANPLTGNRITDPHRQVVNIVAKSGVPFSPHDLRRTFASIVSRLAIA